MNKRGQWQLVAALFSSADVILGVLLTIFGVLFLIRTWSLPFTLVSGILLFFVLGYAFAVKKANIPWWLWGIPSTMVLIGVLFPAFGVGSLAIVDSWSTQTIEYKDTVLSVRSNTDFTTKGTDNKGESVYSTLVRVSPDTLQLNSFSRHQASSTREAKGELTLQAIRDGNGYADANIKGFKTLALDFDAYLSAGTRRESVSFVRILINDVEVLKKEVRGTEYNAETDSLKDLLLIPVGDGKYKLGDSQIIDLSRIQEDKVWTLKIETYAYAGGVRGDTAEVSFFLNDITVFREQTIDQASASVTNKGFFSFGGVWSWFGDRLSALGGLFS